MRALLPAEREVDEAIVSSAKLIETIVSSRLNTGVALEVGHPAAKRAASWLALLFEAREEAVRCHQELARTRDSQGLDPVQVGCTPDKGIELPTGFTVPSVQVAQAG